MDGTDSTGNGGGRGSQVFSLGMTTIDGWGKFHWGKKKGTRMYTHLPLNEDRLEGWDRFHLGLGGGRGVEGRWKDRVCATF